MPNVAFDVEGTLIDENDEPNEDVIGILRAHHDRGDKIYVWSGGGVEYARMWVRRLDLEPYVKQVITKGKYSKMDISYDDQIVKLAKVNVCVGPANHEERW